MKALVPPLLRCERLSQSFGGIVAVSDLSLEVEAGELVGLIGPNGAGKTTTLRLMAGIQPPKAGQIYFGAANVTRLATVNRVRMGFATTHQIVRPLRNLSVIENVMLAAGSARTASAVRSLFQFSKSIEERKARGLLERLGLSAVADKEPGILPLGQLKRLEVARALALDPKIVVLDEPLAGLNQREASTIADLIVDLNRDGLTIILIEHNLSEVLRICRRLLVLDAGSIIANGDPQTVMAQQNVRTAYLGDQIDAA